MRLFRGQGATRSRSGATYCPLLAQGATEYLVLLAVVLIVALVSVALLGFFPGMASDAQITQSQMYWRGASPIAIIEFGAMIDWFGNTSDVPYLRVRNNGMYPIRITKTLYGSISTSTFYCTGGCPTPYPNISDYFYFSPGEERYFGSPVCFPGIPTNRAIFLSHSSLASSCQVLHSDSPGTLTANNFGFEYIEYIEGQQISKQQIGKPLIIKCRNYP